jgi:hypothetical protein
MEDLSYLSMLDEASFEAERNRLIANEILKADPDRRRKLVAFQMQLDLVRDRVTSEQFMLHCAALLRENLENLSDQLVHLKSLIEPPTIRPVAER